MAEKSCKTVLLVEDGRGDCTDREGDGRAVAGAVDGVLVLESRWEGDGIGDELAMALVRRCGGGTEMACRWRQAKGHCDGRAM